MDGQLRIWELNTLPRLSTPDTYTEDVLELRRPMADRITAALDALDGGAPAAVDRPPVPLRERPARRLPAPSARSAVPARSLTLWRNRRRIGALPSQTRHEFPPTIAAGIAGGCPTRAGALEE